MSRGQPPLDRPLLPFSPTWFSPKSQFMYRGIAPPTPWLAAPPGRSTHRCRSGSYLSQALIYPGAAASVGGTLPWTGPGSPCQISCCWLDDMVITEAEEVEGVVLLRRKTFTFTFTPPIFMRHLTPNTSYQCAHTSQC